ncbi:hypothetical protein, partial [Fodinibius salsisoli]
VSSEAPKRPPRQGLDVRSSVYSQYGKEHVVLPQNTLLHFPRVLTSGAAKYDTLSSKAMQV